MEQDDDEDGRINEDGPDDLNGDDLITSFRYRDPEGRYFQDENDPRIMVRIGRGEEPDSSRERWSVIPEGRDNDGDGKSGEDPERGIDVNRNFPWSSPSTPPAASPTGPSPAGPTVRSTPRTWVSSMRSWA